MRKLTQRFIGFLMIWAVLLMSVMVNVPAKANEGAELTFTFESGIPPRTVYCDGTTNVIGLSINGTYYNLSIDSHIIDYAYCDKDGTLWIVSSHFVSKEGYLIYWTNYELEGNDMTPHYFYTGYMRFCDGFVDSYSNYSNKRFPLPTLDDLKNYLDNGTPVPGSKPKPITEPEPSENKNPTPELSFTILVSGNTTKFVNSNNVVIDKFTFNNKKSVLSYKGKKVKKVKGTWFTEKGKVVYIKGSKQKYKAYYFDGKKSTLIKSGVCSVSTKKKFATALKLKNGKTYQLK